jgi:dihydropyrimidinase
MIHEFGVRAGRISLNRMVELLATNPAKLFGLYPRKGTIAPGSDADIVVFDPDRRHLITAATQHSRVDYNLYEGTDGVRIPELVMLRGTFSSSPVSCSWSRVSESSSSEAAFGQELPARRRTLTTSCAEARRTHSPLSGASAH